MAPRWLLGIEGDISWISLARTRTVPTIGPGSFATMSATNHWLASVRGRVGFIGWSKTLYYILREERHILREERHGPAPKYNGHMTRIIGADAPPLNRGVRRML